MTALATGLLDSLLTYGRTLTAQLLFIAFDQSSLYLSPENYLIWHPCQCTPMFIPLSTLDLAQRFPPRILRWYLFPKSPTPSLGLTRLSLLLDTSSPTSDS